MINKGELDEAGSAIARVVRTARETLRTLEAGGDKADKDALKRAKDDLADALKLEEAAAEIHESLDKREKEALKAAEKAEKDAEKAADKAEHKVAVMEHKSEEHPHHAPVHKK
ncbi:MAG TPA: hypothetical protein VGK73_03060 [Polyangiaceae bacterium]